MAKSTVQLKMTRSAGRHSVTPLSAQGSYDKMKIRRVAAGSWCLLMFPKTRWELLHGRNRGQHPIIH